MKTAILIVAQSVTLAFAWSQKYDVRSIPPGLRMDAPAVIREMDITYEVTDEHSAVETFKQVVTVFAPGGREYGLLRLPYDRFSRIRDLDGALLDERGEEIRTLSGDDVKDESDIALYILYEDARIRMAELYHDTYPYTVVFTYRRSQKGYVSWPTWFAQPSDEPVEHTRFEVTLPEQMKLRYWASTDSAKPVTTVPEPGRVSYVWEARNIPQASQDAMDEDIEKRTTVVRVAPGAFRIDDYAGDMTTWQNFGRWAYGLYTGRDALPAAAHKEVEAATAGARTAREKIDTLYRYMQSRTRYVAVELGIGGWQPFDAGIVQEKRYGDCKALSNYMVALLKAAGITAYPALIHAGGYRSRVVEEFPSNVFNHEIVCIPGSPDSVWLECTSPYDPPGHLGPFTENRAALLLTPTGGVLVHTPASAAVANRCAWSGRIVVPPAGGASGTLAVLWTGDQSEGPRFTLRNSSPREQEEWMLKKIHVPGTSLRGRQVTATRADAVGISMQIDDMNLGALTGGRLFFQPNLTNRNALLPRNVKGRKSPVRLAFPYIDSDSLLFVLPPGYTGESLPSPVSLSAPFGRFRSSAIAIRDTAILYTRTLEIRSPLIPAEQYNQYAEFFRSIARADKAQVVLSRKN